jgi:hypothetical protein
LKKSGTGKTLGFEKLGGEHTEAATDHQYINALLAYGLLHCYWDSYTADCCT